VSMGRFWLEEEDHWSHTAAPKTLDVGREVSLAAGFLLSVPNDKR
jgi:hypothetical protein